ncbi:phosphopyruvate hydratase [Acididesulfobacillus acetoxydans]|uniref:Enolase n=1 Tax=Acididesulfobacillus acetoxydans TaxID=1561005 RepID=A0A8S0WXD0_9FIRM|nr:enolase [Acididesulfobacillus acetoxydans]CAA7600881.1 phosphopyruvate hydratase [Acididesulfobacillus acetoxydans]CEJ07925.1 Enolase [Acididesulfobacillus acetoxydans]
MSRIKNVVPRQIFDTKGRPMLEVDIVTDNGAMGRGSSPTGTSVGKHEAVVLRDMDISSFGGLGVSRAIKNIQEIVAPAIIGMDVNEQELIDNTIIALDGTKNKARLGGNTIYSTSIAVARAAACSNNLPLYRYLAKGKEVTIPVPTFNMINGGSYGASRLDFQEFMIVPWKAQTFREAMQIAVEVFYILPDIIRKKGGLVNTGNYSGYGAPVQDPAAVLDILSTAAEAAGYLDKIVFALDCAASEIYDETRNKYRFMEQFVTREDIINVIKELSKKYPLLFVEDILQEDDFAGFALATEQLYPTLVVGDDLFTTNIERVKTGIKMHAGNGIILKPNQVGSLTEALVTKVYASERGFTVIPSGRAGGAVDDPIREIAVGIKAPLVKVGAPRSGERINSMNQLLRIEETLTGPRTLADIGAIIAEFRLD